MTPKGHAIPSKTQLLSYGTPAFAAGCFSALQPSSSKIFVNYVE